SEAADRAGPALAPRLGPVANVSPEHRIQWDIEKSGSLGRSSMLRGSTEKKHIAASLLSCNSPPSRVRRPAILWRVITVCIRTGSSTTKPKRTARKSRRIAKYNADTRMKTFSRTPVFRPKATGTDMAPRAELPIATGTAADFIPPRPSLRTLREAARLCRGCKLWTVGTQTVFGEGPARARVMIVGEQPGDQEDKEGHPFVGPAGGLL